MMLTVLFLRFFDLQPTCAPTARMMLKHTPAISVLYSVRVTLTNHYWVTSDKRRRSRAKYAYLEEASIPVRLHVLNIENMPHDVADNLPCANQITHEFTCVIRTGWNHFCHRFPTTRNA